MGGSAPPGASAFLVKSLFDADYPFPTAFRSVEISGAHGCTNDFGIFSNDEWHGSVRSPTIRQPDRCQRQERNPPRSEEPKVTVFRWCTCLSLSIVPFPAPLLSSLRRCFLVGTGMKMMGPTV